MFHNDFNAYVPETLQWENKDIAPMREFHEDFALLDANGKFVPVAFRGPAFQGQTCPEFSKEMQNRILEALSCHWGFADLADGTLTVFFRDFLGNTGLVAAVCPHCDPASVTLALRSADSFDILLSDTLLSMEDPAPDPETAYRQLTDFLFRYRRIAAPPEEEEFRLHCALIADFAGCRSNVTSLPVGSYPISSGDYLRWTVFLLSLFLNLRGDSARDTVLQFSGATTEAFQFRLVHTSQRTPSLSKRVNKKPYPALALPCFSDFAIEKAGNLLHIEARLKRKSHDGFVHAMGDGLLLSLELIFTEENPPQSDSGIQNETDPEQHQNRSAKVSDDIRRQ